MGGGGSVQGAKINKHLPERKRANKQLRKTIRAINTVVGNEIMRKGIEADDTPLLMMQQQLHQSNEMLQGVMSQAAGLMQTAANSPAMVGQNAVQMANLVGPPPPEKSAEKVVVGKARGVETEADRNRRSLRIDLTTST
jgi:hypothetical protein